MNKFTTYRFTILLFIAVSVSMIHASAQSGCMCFVTVSDTEHFPWLEGLIESILKYNYTKVSKIAVFDLGLTQAEIAKLNQMEFVEVHEIEDINSEMRKKFVVRTNGRLARGWYSWKPVVLYQALKMFPSFLYLDSGIEVAAPLDSIFEEIEQNGYYLYDCPHLIFPVLTDHVRQLFELDGDKNKWLLEENGISAGIMGVSRSLLELYISPVYQLAFEIKCFEDDGTAPWGYGFARHEQALFSVLTHKLGLKTHPLYCIPKKIRVGDRKIYFGVLKHFKLRKHVEKDAARLEHARVHKLLG